MQDAQILDLYWSRDERAIQHTDEKYHIYCYTIADRILKSAHDAEECVNDTWLRAWNSIPPQRPSNLRLFLGKITRNLSLDRYRRLHADKRGGGELPGLLEELETCATERDTVFEEVHKNELAARLNRFLAALPIRERTVFLKRYFYAMSVQDIARQLGLTENNTSKILSRTRDKLKAYLGEEDAE